MGFSGGGSSQTKPHTHDSNIVNDGGSLNLDNVTQGSLTSGDITYSDGIHLQRLAIGGAGDQLQVTAGLPSWVSASAAHESGMIAVWAGTNAAIPAGWLLCDGASVATATYPALFTALGYTYGGAGANFNLPNLVDVFVRGQSTQTATTGGANSQTLSTANLASHSHVVTDPGHTHQIYKFNGGGAGPVSAYRSSYVGTAQPAQLLSGSLGTSTTGITNANTGSGSGFDNQPAFLEMQYIIKT